MNKEQYQKLRDKIIEAVGKKENYSLEDVLVSLTKTTENRTHRNAKDDVWDLCRMWDLNKKLEEQSSETKDFLADLIINK